MEVRELLNEYDFPGDDVPVVRGSALAALEGKEDGVNAVLELMNQVDSYIEEPTRVVDKPFLMPVEDVFSITGRGTVVTGRICLLYTSPSPRDKRQSRMPSSA